MGIPQMALPGQTSQDVREGYFFFSVEVRCFFA